MVASNELSTVNTYTLRWTPKRRLSLPISNSSTPVVVDSSEALFGFLSCTRGAKSPAFTTAMREAD